MRKAAAVAGVMQQVMGALGGVAVGWVTHDGQVNLALLMLGFTLCAVAAQAALRSSTRTTSSSRARRASSLQAAEVVAAVRPPQASTASIGAGVSTRTA